MKRRGQVGLIIVLLVLLAIASAVILNSRSSDQAPDSQQMPNTQLENFKDEAKKIEDLQKKQEELPKIDTQ